MRGSERTPGANDLRDSLRGHSGTLAQARAHSPGPVFGVTRYPVYWARLACVIVSG